MAEKAHLPATRAFANKIASSPRSWPAPCAFQIPAADLISPIRPRSSRARKKKEEDGDARCEPPLRRSGRRRGQKAAGGRGSESAKKRGVRELEAEKPAASSARRAGGTVAVRRPLPRCVGASGCAAAGRDF
uniref:Uncharacterized protein n=1 Tax=Oryza glumipatula TaxID=40148 RepID=A0A0E0ASZ1_9ORYZ